MESTRKTLVPQQQTQKPTLADLLNHYSVYNQLTNLLPVGDLIRLSRTCKGLSTLYQEQAKTNWDIDRFLSPFFPDAKRFRSGMADSGALIAGLYAENFFARKHTDDWLAEVFVEQGYGADVLDRQLKKQEGYVLAKDRPVLRDFTVAIREYTKVTKIRGTKTRQVRNIEVLVTEGPPIRCIFKTLGMTARLSIISSSNAYSLFPVSTHERRKSYLLRELYDWYLEKIEECKPRAFDIFSRPLGEEEHDEVKIGACRSIGDRMTWKIPFDMTGVRESKIPETVLRQSSFEIWRREWEMQSDTLSIIAPLLRSLVLKHQYTMPRGGFRTFLEKKLHQLSAKQLYKLPNKCRPPSLRIAGRIGQIHNPWRYWDDEALKRDGSDEPWKYWDHKMQDWAAEYAATLKRKEADEKLKAEPQCSKTRSLADLFAFPLLHVLDWIFIELEEWRAEDWCAEDSLATLLTVLPCLLSVIVLIGGLHERLAALG